MEIWKNIPWFNTYQISNLWNIKSFKNNKWGLNKYWKILKLTRINKIYKWLDIIDKNNNRKILRVHRLVLYVFKWLDIKNKKLHWLHKCEKLCEKWFLDNSLENLFIWTHKDNMKDRDKKWRYISWMKGQIWKKCKNSKKIIQKDLNNNFIKKWDSMKNVFRELWINNKNISLVCLWKRKTAWWYKWEYNW